jgi:Terminase RNaseH-like domain
MSFLSLQRTLDRVELESKALSLLNVEYNPYGISEDFKEFAKTCQIRSGVDFVPFDLFEYQVEISNLFDSCRGLAILKTRQVGASELLAAKMLHRSLLNPAYLGVAFSLGQQESSKLSDRVGMMPNGVQDFRWAIESKTARKSERGGELLFRPSTPNAARSLASVTDLFMDECGFPADIEEMYGNATPAQSMVGEAAKRILGTTIPPEGLSCWFGRTFWQGQPFDLDEEIARVQEGRGRQDKGFSYWIDDQGWARILLHWQSHPIYSVIPNYLDRIRKSEQITEEQLQREHNLGLPANGASLFLSEAVAAAAIGNLEKPRRSQYLVGIDPNFGAVGGDYFVCQVWDIGKAPFNLAAEYRSNESSVYRSKEECLKLIEDYRPVIVSIEANGGGVAIAEDIARAMPRLQVEMVRTTQVSKRLHTDRAAMLIERGDIIYPADWIGISELQKFSAITRQATTGNDDCVMGMAIAFAYLDEALEMTRRRDISWMKRD